MLNQRVFDYGLQVLILETTTLHVCINLPNTYTEAVTGNSLGVKPSPMVAGPQDWIPNGSVEGRKVTVQAFMDGIINHDGKVSYWALVDDNNHRLLATMALSAPKDIVTGNTFSLPDFDIAIPYAPETAP